jgi:hypothetical protein
VGYTHYWRRPTILPVRAFTRATTDCRTVTDWLARERRIAIQYESDDDAPPCFDSTAVWFNGVGEEGHETFHVPRVYEPHEWEVGPAYGGRFAFCKTARKPYDTAVCACLIVLKHHLGRKFRVSSDGTDEDTGWTVAREACQQVLGYGGDFTLSVPVRLGKGGLPYERVLVGSDGRTTYRLANGWYLVRQRGGRDRERQVLVVADYDADPAAALAWAPTLAAARWVATCEFLAREFKDAPYLDEFLPAVKANPGEWLVLLAWADKMDDRSSEFGPKLRAYLPR